MCVVERQELASSAATRNVVKCRGEKRDGSSGPLANADVAKIAKIFSLLLKRFSMHRYDPTRHDVRPTLRISSQTSWDILNLASACCIHNNAYRLNTNSIDKEKGSYHSR